ncbi:zinc-dependent metalloprotease [Portibacter marinus]|uniref:zinc-dependent metalloprotease n=1 Tax=Portibacter marinus TaxID=2898660 RepID=UPI001F47597A|nr:zinc-dependent metalloprotease [Portibacter marinus]
MELLLRRLLLSKKYYAFLLIIMSALSVHGQELSYCGTEGLDVEWETYLRENKGVMTRSFNDDIYVAITVHVVGEDDGIGYHPLSTILKSLEGLNEDFKASRIQFYLAGPFNYINNSAYYEHSSFGTGAQMMNEHNVANTINCYIVNDANGNCGYRSFNGDAIALSKSCTQANDHTWAHEMGHWLSLPHTFSGWEGTDYNLDEETPTNVGSKLVEKVSRDNCTSAADRLCDTSPDYLSFRWGCDENNEYPDSLRDPDGVKFAVDGSLFMSYAFDDCQSRFSDGQIEKMQMYANNWVPEVVSDDPPQEEIDPGQTKLLYPINGEVVEDKIELRWEEQGNATFYVVEVSQISNMALLSLRELVYGTKLEVFGLSPDKDYYWRVRPLNDYHFDYDKRTETENFKTGELSSTEEYYAENLKIYPNPISRASSIYINLKSSISEDMMLDIFSLDGKPVIRKSYYLQNGLNQLEIDASSLTAGIYILRGKGELHNFRKKIVIE